MALEIKNIKAREILDSRANPAIEVEIIAGQNVFSADVPAGASRGKNEAVELRDGGKRYLGKGVLKAINNINKIIAPKIIKKDFKNQREVDDFLIELDGTKNKSKLGGNAICGVSLAFARFFAFKNKKSLYRSFGAKEKSGIKMPKPCFNVINGGAHAGGELDFQEFMLVPQEKKFSQNLMIATEIYLVLKEIIRKKYGKSGVNVGDEGGYVPPVKFPEQAIELIMQAAQKLNYDKKIKLFIDVAASQFFRQNRYQTAMKNFSSEELCDYYLKLFKSYPVLGGIEDPMAENDFKGWQVLMIKSQILKPLIIGDDLTVTNPGLIKKAEEKKLCNAVIIKINQIGTVSEALEAIKLAKSFDWKTVVSHRSGETIDDFIADFSVGTGADFIKTGAPCRGERVAKYNRLKKIEEEKANE